MTQKHEPLRLLIEPLIRRAPTCLVRAIVAAGLCATALAAQAGRPMVVEDADILEAKACHVEAWAQRNRGESTEYWVVPACNPTGNLEIAVGGVRLREGGEHTTAGVVQVQTVFKEIAPNSWGVGLVVGNQYERRSRFWNDLYAAVPLSVSLRDDALRLHANLGWRREREGRRDFATAGLGAELELTARTAFIAETFVEDAGRPFYHLGVRAWIVPERLQLDATYGNRFGGAHRTSFASVGIVLISPPFLP